MKINIDKLFRNKIKEFKVTTPDGVWSAVETKLKRRRMLRFFGVSFVSFMGFMFLFFQAEKIVTTDLQKNTTTKQLVKEDSANKFSIVPKVKTPEKVSSFVSDKSKEGQLKLISSPKNSSKLSSNFIIKESIREESFQKVITNTVVEKQLKKFDSPVNNLDSLKKIKKKDLKKKRKELVKKNDAIDSIKFEKTNVKDGMLFLF